MDKLLEDKMDLGNSLVKGMQEQQWDSVNDSNISEGYCCWGRQMVGTHGSNEEMDEFVVVVEETNYLQLFEKVLHSQWGRAAEVEKIYYFLERELKAHWEDEQMETEEAYFSKSVAQLNCSGVVLVEMQSFHYWYPVQMFRWMVD